jgi:hypothetical protein
MHTFLLDKYLVVRTLVKAVQGICHWGIDDSFGTRVYWLIWS